MSLQETCDSHTIHYRIIILLEIILAHGIITRGIMARNNSDISEIIARQIIVHGKCNNTFPSITARGIIASSNNLQH